MLYMFSVWLSRGMRFFSIATPLKSQKTFVYHYQGHINAIFYAICGFAGQFNSWDRQPYVVHDQPALPGDEPTWRLTPALHQLRGNFILNINFLGSCDFCFYAIDLDDGSSQYNITGNVLVYGGVKVSSRDNYCHVW